MLADTLEISFALCPLPLLIFQELYVLLFQVFPKYNNVLKTIFYSTLERPRNYEFYEYSQSWINCNCKKSDLLTLKVIGE